VRRGAGKMRFVLGLLLALCGLAPASASSFVKPLGQIILDDQVNPVTGGGPRTIAPGEKFAIACGCLSGERDVRVVFMTAKNSDEKPLGFKRLLVTGEQLDKGAVRVRVPETPSLANHTFDVRVYVVGPKSVRACDAGRLKIG